LTNKLKPGVICIKNVTVYRGFIIIIIFLVLGQMFHCYKKCKEIGAIAQVHAENGTLIAEVKYCSCK